MLDRVVVVWYLVLLDVQGKRDKDAVGMMTLRRYRANSFSSRNIAGTPTPNANRHFEETEK